MKSYSNITCGILTPLDLSSLQSGAVFLQLLSQYELLSPTHIGNSEPISEQYNDISIGLRSWKDPFLWRNNRANVTGSVWFGRGSSHSCVYVHLSPLQGSLYDEDLSFFLQKACPVLVADIGYIHLTTQDEFSDTDIPYECTYAIDTGLTTNDLRKKVPKLSWGTYFSGAYKEIVQRFRTFSPPVIMTEPTSDSIYVQLTDSMTSILDDYQIFKKVRFAVQNQIGGDYLFGVMNDAWKPHFNFRASTTDLNPDSK
jgi:hypothetical protein